MDSQPIFERERVIEALFSIAAGLSTEERASFLNQACGKDTALRNELESLLAVDTVDDRFLESVISDVAQHLAESQTGVSGEGMVGCLVGPYRIADLIGKGGMGAVYRAIREDHFHMQVALKVIKRGADTDYAINQFRIERQILARLQHPNIARLLDGGATTDGLPYFVLEYVEGQPITDYCRIGNLGTAARLRLFRSICAAVQYAHQNLIVHRDLKPSNILITKEGIPKLLDFGIAKLLAPAESGQTGFSLTSAGLRLMTLDYASPEQVFGLPLTTAADIYSLGVVLYELLSGQRPYRIRTRSPLELEEAICHEEPTNPVSVCKQIDRDLAKILLKALRKEPQRRYTSVEQFSNDIGRYLEGRPILARKDTFVYRGQKFVQRHTIAVGMSLVIAGGLVTGVAAVHNQAVRAQRRFQQVRRLADTMIFDLHDQIASLPGATKARQSLVKTAIEYLDSLAAEAAGDPQLQLELATAYEKVGDVQGNMANSHLGHPEAAIVSYRKGLAIASKLAPSGVVLELAARFYYKIGDVQHRLLGRPTEGRKSILAAVQVAESIPVKTGDPAYKERAEAAGWLGELDILRNPDQALSPLRKSLAVARQWAAAQPQSDSAFFRVIALTRLGEALWQTGAFSESLKVYLEAITIMEQLAREHPEKVDWQQQLAVCYEFAGIVSGHPMYINMGDRPAAVNWFQKMLAIFQRLSDADLSDVRSQFELSEALASLASAVRQSDPVRAERLYRRSLVLNEAIVQSKPDDALAPRWQAFNRMGLAWVLSRKQQHGAAIQELEKALALQQSSLAREPTDPQFQEELGVILCALGAERRLLGDRAGASAQLHRALAILLPLRQANTRKLPLLRDLANCYEKLGNLAASGSDWNEARSWYAKSKELWNTWPSVAPSSSFDLTQNRRVTRLLDHATRTSKRLGPSG